MTGLECAKCVRYIIFLFEQIYSKKGFSRKKQHVLQFSFELPEDVPGLPPVGLRQERRRHGRHAQGDPAVQDEGALLMKKYLFFTHHLSLIRAHVRENL